MYNVFSKTDYHYQMHKNIFGIPGLFFKDLKYCWQRICNGYCEKDTFSIDYWFLNVVPKMLKKFKENLHGAPGILLYKDQPENFMNSPQCLNLSVEDTDVRQQENSSVKDINVEWAEILERMIFLFNEANEENCEKKNPFEEEYEQVRKEFSEKYGKFGEKLNEGKEENHVGTEIHFPREVPEYKEISEKFLEEEKKLNDYRDKCKNEAFELFSKWFWCLWD